MPSLTFKNRQFFLKGEPFRILSGSIHYFRVFPEHWQDRLLKAKACGLNTIDTYIAWNAHEPRPGVFKNDGILDFRRFVKMAADLDLYVILRPGPYICSEWDFGGLPSWLLADPDMKVRSNYQGYAQPAERFLAWVLGQVVDLQHSVGGPIIAVQVENEFGSYCRDPDHLTFVKDVLLRNGVTELLITSDNEWAAKTAPYLDGVLPTANFQTPDQGQVVFDTIIKTHSDYPLMVMEFWTGWFDHWGSAHETRGVDLLEESLKFCFEKQASVNFYMFFGGTNFGFMSGANHESSFKPDITSYDYSAPLAEDGSVTEKYLKIKEMIQEEREKKGLPSVVLPPIPQTPNRISTRRVIPLQQTMAWSDITSIVTKTTSSSEPRYMETYQYPNNQIQSHGYIVYRRLIKGSSSPSELVLPRVNDHANIITDGRVVATFDQKETKPTVNLSLAQNQQTVLDIMVENLGRVNYTSQEDAERLNTQRKGMNGQVTLDGESIKDWQVIALDFSDDFLQTVATSGSWKPFDQSVQGQGEGSPALFRANLEVCGQPLDAFVRLEGFVKGIVIVNGFNLGRYWDIGPQRTLYLPGPLLQEGNNDVIIFEEIKAVREISLEVEPILG